MILHEIRLRRPADDAGLDDLAGAPAGPARWVDCDVHGAADCLLVPFDTDPPAAHEHAIRVRLVTTDPDDEARLYVLLRLRPQAKTPIEKMWVETELAKYDPSL